MLHKPVRVFLIRKKFALAAGALLAAAAIFCAVNVPAAITAVAAARQLPIYSVDRSSDSGKKYCAISFDAAWGDGKVRQQSRRLTHSTIVSMDQPLFRNESIAADL